METNSRTPISGANFVSLLRPRSSAVYFDDVALATPLTGNPTAPVVVPRQVWPGLVPGHPTARADRGPSRGYYTLKTTK